MVPPLEKQTSQNITKARISQAWTAGSYTSDQYKYGCFLSTVIVNQNGSTREIGPAKSAGETQGFSWNSHDSFGVGFDSYYGGYNPYIEGTFSLRISGTDGSFHFRTSGAELMYWGQYTSISDQKWTFTGSIEQIHNSDGTCTRTKKQFKECSDQYIYYDYSQLEPHPYTETSGSICNENPDSVEANVECVSDPESLARDLWSPSGASGYFGQPHWGTPLAVTGTYMPPTSTPTPSPTATPTITPTATPTATPTSTPGSTPKPMSREEGVAIAKEARKWVNNKNIGYEYGNKTPISDATQRPIYSDCSNFIHRVFNQRGVPTEHFGTGSFGDKNSLKYYDPISVKDARSGDVIINDVEGAGKGGHAGIVDRVENGVIYETNVRAMGGDAKRPHDDPLFLPATRTDKTSIFKSKATSKNPLPAPVRIFRRNSYGR